MTSGDPGIQLPACMTDDDTSLLLDSCPVDAFIGPWWVVHTRSRHEKALAADLDHRGIGCYLPLARTKRRHGGRSVEVEVLGQSAELDIDPTLLEPIE